MMLSVLSTELYHTADCSRVCWQISDGPYRPAMLVHRVEVLACSKDVLKFNTVALPAV